MEHEPARYIYARVCPMTAMVNALRRFATRYIPHFRKRAERAAVGTLIDKLRTTVDCARDARTAASESSARRTR